MAEISGYGGKFKWSRASDVTYTALNISDATYNIHAWNADLTVDPLETTGFADSGNKTFVRGLKAWTAAAEAYADSTNAIQPSDVGLEGTIYLYPNTTTYWTGAALLTGVHPAVAVDGVVTQTLDFQGTAALTHIG